MDKSFWLERFKNKKLLTQLFTVLSGFSTLLLIVVSIVVKRQTTAAFINSNNLIYSNMLEVSMSTMDALFSGFHDSLTHITYDGSIIGYVVAPDPEDSISKFHVLSSLDGYCQENEAMEEVFLYVAKDNQILTSGYDAERLDNFPRKGLINSHLNSSPATTLLKSGRTSSIEIYQDDIYMVRDFPLSGERRLGTLFMKINPAVLYHTLAAGQTSYCFLLAYDSQWNPLFPSHLDYGNFPGGLSTAFLSSDGGRIRTACIGKRHYFYTTSDQTHLNMLLSVNDTFFVPSYQIIIKNSLPFFALILILSGLLLVSILYLSYMPVLKLINVVSSDKAFLANEKSENEWNYITGRFLDISSQKQQLGYILDRMIPKISKEFYFELLNGRPMEYSYICNILKHINSPIKPDGTYQNISVAFSDLADEAAKSTIMDNLSHSLELASTELFHYIIQQIDGSLYIIMIQYETNASTLQMASFEVKLEQIFFNSLMGRKNIAWIEPGPKCNTIQAISFSYMESLQQLTQKKYPASQAKKKEPDIPENVILNPHYYQIQAKTISGFIMNGEASEALQKSLQISQSLFGSGNCEEIFKACEYFRLSLLDMLSSYHVSIKEDGILNSEEASLKNEAFKDLDFLRSYMNKFCTNAIRLLNEKYLKQNHKYLIITKQYIEQNYSDSNLSLNAVAQQCQTTTSYLSRLFKESFGINFVDYLNQYRIGKAKELLLAKDITLKEIALATGYNSQQNFIRVFKKYTGITPGQFKTASNAN